MGKTEFFEEYIAEKKVTTHCKHGDSPCKKCGTSKNDVIHTTKKGKGKVAALFKKTK